LEFVIIVFRYSGQGDRYKTDSIKRMNDFGSFFFVEILAKNKSVITCFVSGKITRADYKENVKRSQFLLAILENEIIKSESAYLKTLSFNINLRTVYPK
jgi:hypothetical protein